MYTIIYIYKIYITYIYIYMRGGFLGAVSVGGSADGLSELRSLRIPSSLAALCSALLAVLAALDTLESLYEPLTSPKEQFSVPDDDACVILNDLFI